MNIVHGFKDLDGLRISINMSEVRMVRERGVNHCTVFFMDNTAIEVAHGYEDLERTLRFFN